MCARFFCARDDIIIFCVHACVLQQCVHIVGTCIVCVCVRLRAHVHACVRSCTVRVLRACARGMPGFFVTNSNKLCVLTISLRACVGLHLRLLQDSRTTHKGGPPTPSFSMCTCKARLHTTRPSLLMSLNRSYELLPSCTQLVSRTRIAAVACRMIFIQYRTGVWKYLRSLPTDHSPNPPATKKKSKNPENPYYPQK